MKLLYVYDALCGWCYGFSAVVKELKDQFGSELEFEVISGGMVTGSRVRPIGEIADFISGSLSRVEDVSGEKFGLGFINGTLREGTVLLDSLPPAKALKIFKEFRPERSVEFARDIQKAIYFSGEDSNLLETYLDMLDAYDFSKRDFEILWNSPDYHVRAQEEFLLTKQLGVTGFPAVFLQSGNEYHQIANGYTEYSTIEKRLVHVLQTVNATGPK